MKMSLRQYCIEHGRDTLLREWDAEKNGGLTPSDVSFGSQRFLRKSSKGMVAVLQGSQLAGEGLLPFGGQWLSVLYRTQRSA